jgi:DNA-binding transcriptional LysR family regulator
VAQVRLSRLNTEHVFEQVESYRIDLGFVEGPGDSRNVRRIPWRTDHLVVFCAPDHPLAQQSVTPDHLSAAEWIVREPGSGTREVMAHALLASGITPNIAFELEQPEAIRRCVRAGLGIGCLSELELEEAFRAGTLVPLATPFLDMKRNLDLIIHRNKALTGGVSALLKAADITLPPAS